MIGPGPAPLQRLALALLVVVIVLGGAIGFAVSQPWLGLSLHYDAHAGGAVIQAATGPAQAVPVGTVIVAVSGGGDRLTIEPNDLTTQVDGSFGPFADFQRFMTRQGRFADMQRGAQLTLTDATGRDWTIRPRARRPVTSLGIELWIGLVVGAVSWLMAAAIAAFRPKDISARYVLLSGAAMLACAPMGPLYTSRELGLPTLAFYLINGSNFLGGSLFGAAIFVTLLYYPKPLAPRWVGLAVIGVFLVWYVVQAIGLFADLTFARRFLVMCALIGAFILSAVHWRRTRRDPIARAALSWFVLSWVVVVGAFGFTILAPQMFGADTSAAEPFAFLLFLLVYVGLAVGIMRYRLFELGVWWVRIVTWTLGLALLVALDMALLVGLQLSAGVSLSLALLVCGLIWLPVRTWIADRLLRRRKTDERATFEGVIQVALAPSAAARTERWTAVLRERFDPLSIALADPVDAARLEQDGLAVVTPAVHGAPSLRLEYPHAGRALFTPADLSVVNDFVSLLGVVVEGRDAYERGIVNERRRIAGDIHDNLGATLLGALHSRDQTRKDHYIRDGLSDLRSIVADLAADEHGLVDVLARARHEMAERLQAQGVELDWPLIAHLPLTLDPKRIYALRAMLRELTNNVVKHARAKTVRVDLASDEQGLSLTLEDDGVGFDRAAPTAGSGLAGLAARAARYGGEVRWSPRSDGPGTRVAIRLPTAPVP